LKEHQKLSYLTSEELDLFLIMLKIALLKFISRIALNISNSQLRKMDVETIISTEYENNNLAKDLYNELKYLRNFKDYMQEPEKIKSTNTAFVEYMAYRLKEMGTRGENYYKILNLEAEKIGFTIEEAIVKEHMEIAKTTDYIGRAILSYKQLQGINFREIFEKVNKTDETLKDDYSKEFKKCDYKTKTRYRNYIIKLAKKYNLSEVYVAKKAVVVTLSTIDDAPIYYTLDGTEPTTTSLKYTEPVAITETADFQAVVIRPEGKSKVVNKKISFNKATYCPIELTFQPSEKYKFGGAITLVDGMKGNDSYATGAWLGFVGGDVEAIIDLGQETEIKRVATNAIVDMSAWIMGSTGLVVSVSDDNKEFREVAVKDIPAETNIDKKGVENYEITFDPVKARYVKVVIKRSPALPKGHAGEGKAAYMFIDEIEVN